MAYNDEDYQRTLAYLRGENPDAFEVPGVPEADPLARKGGEAEQFTKQPMLAEYTPSVEIPEVRELRRVNAANARDYSGGVPNASDVQRQSPAGVVYPSQPPADIQSISRSPEDPTGGPMPSVSTPPLASVQAPEDGPGRPEDPKLIPPGKRLGATQPGDPSFGNRVPADLPSPPHDYTPREGEDEIPLKLRPSDPDDPGSVIGTGIVNAVTGAGRELRRAGKAWKAEAAGRAAGMTDNFVGPPSLPPGESPAPLTSSSATAATGSAPTEQVGQENPATATPAAPGATPKAGAAAIKGPAGNIGVVVGPHGISYFDKKTGEPVSPETFGAMMAQSTGAAPKRESVAEAADRINGLRNLAVQSALHTQAYRAVQEAENAKKLLNDTQDLNDRVEGRKAVEGIHLSEERAKVDAARKEADDARLDGRSYLERNPLSGIMLAIGATIGGALSARSGQPNAGMQALTGAIDRDIALQKYGIDRKDAKFDRANSILAKMQDQFGKGAIADAAAKAVLFEQASLHQQKIAAETKVDTIRDNAALAAVNSMDAANRQRLYFENLLKQQIGTGMSKAGAKAEAKLQENLIGRYVPGWGVARLNDDSSKMRAQKASFDMVEGGLEKLIGLSKGIGFGTKLADKTIYTTEQMDAVKSELNALIQPWNTATGGGVASEPEAKRIIETTIGGLTSGRSVENSIKHALEIVRRQKDLTRRAYGFIDTKEGYVVDAQTGRLHQVSELEGKGATEKPKPPTSFIPVTPVSK